LIRVGNSVALCWLSLAGCHSVLGVEDVELEGGGGGGSDATSSEGVGAGLVSSVGPSGTASSGAQSSASTGGSLCDELPACEGAVPNAFEASPELDGHWNIDRRKVSVKDQQLQLDPDEDVASIRSKSNLNPSSGCAVWISLVDLDPRSIVGMSVGSGTPGTDLLSIFRSGDAIGVSTAGNPGSTLALTEPDATHVLRLRFDGAGSVAADVKSLGGCYQQVGSPASTLGTSPAVSVFQLGNEGKAKLDDFCL